MLIQAILLTSVLSKLAALNRIVPYNRCLLTLFGYLTSKPVVMVGRCYAPHSCAPHGGASSLDSPTWLAMPGAALTLLGWGFMRVDTHTP